MRYFLVVALVLFFACSDGGLKTESGIKYEIITEGTGDIPVQGDVVSVHYTGVLLDGTKFDSSLDRNMPFNFMTGVGNVIKGWDEIVVLMTTGSKWRVTIPSELAYGETGNASIPPNSDLIFELELRDIVKETFTTDSGIQYTIIEAGNGPIPDQGQKVSVHYNVWLPPDWRKLDSSFFRGTPYTVEVGVSGVIKGWHEVLSIMPVGSRWKVLIPSDLAYGPAGRSEIPPNTDLTFEMQLLEIQKN
ncbi:FKBP-type peptidyl-prolyl cis-trans isomerase [candidate division KSB1 bacterium]